MTWGLSNFQSAPASVAVPGSTARACIFLADARHLRRTPELL